MKDERKIILVSGKPGIGKTSLLQKVHSYYKTAGVKIGGILTQEVRGGKNERIGFKIRDLGSDQEGWLATKEKEEIGNGPRVGRYTVHTADLESVGTRALESALACEDVKLIIVDEGGPMEMVSGRFKDAIMRMFEQTERPVLASYNYSFVRALLVDPVFRVEVKIDNREELLKTITDRLNEWLGRGLSN